MARVKAIFGVNCLLLARYFFQMSSPNLSMTRKRRSLLPLVCIPEPMNLGTPRWASLRCRFHSYTATTEDNWVNLLFTKLYWRKQLLLIGIVWPLKNWSTFSFMTSPLHSKANLTNSFITHKISFQSKTSNVNLSCLLYSLS